MTMLTTIPAKAGSTSVDGIDVTQLLQAIGEASVITSAVDLFGLLLAAQRVLAAGSASIDPHEAVLLASSRAMSDVSCDRLVGLGPRRPSQRGGE